MVKKSKKAASNKKQEKPRVFHIPQEMITSFRAAQAEALHDEMRRLDHQRAYSIAMARYIPVCNGSHPIEDYKAI